LNATSVSFMDSFRGCKSCCGITFPLEKFQPRHLQMSFT
jgi:hypothetical protein